MAYIGKSPAVAALTASDITDGIISNAKLAQDIMSAETALAVAPAATDEFLLSDAGVLKRIDASLVGRGKVLQLLLATTTTLVAVATTTHTDIGLSLAITPSATSSKIYALWKIQAGTGSTEGFGSQLLRGVRSCYGHQSPNVRPRYLTFRPPLSSISSHL